MTALGISFKVVIKKLKFNEIKKIKFNEKKKKKKKTWIYWHCKKKKKNHTQVH